MKFILFFIISLSFSISVFSQVQIGLLKYSGGGDWYANPTSLPNLIKYIQEKKVLAIQAKVETVSPLSPNLYKFHILHTTGHGNITFSESERIALRHYLFNGGFLHVDDNYGMAPFFFKEAKLLFPDLDLVELPRSYGLFNAYFSFPDGLPKIHEHDGKPPQAFGIFHQGRLVLLFTTETDLGDGWEDPEVHNNPPDVRELALKMGVNMIVWATQQ